MGAIDTPEQVSDSTGVAASKLIQQQCVRLETEADLRKGKGRGRMGGEEMRVRGPWGKIHLRKRRLIKPSENRCSQKFK